MGKKRFFDDRLKYLSFIQNTGEKKAISEKLYPHIASLPNNKSYLKILDAGTGDGTIFTNLIKGFHRYHPYSSLLMAGKEVSFEDLKNTLEKMPDRFVEHPNLLITMTNVKFSEISEVENKKSISGKKIKSFNLILKSNNSFDFNKQITGSMIGNFIKRNWGIEINKAGRTSYANPCIIRIYREDHKKYLSPFITRSYKDDMYDLIIASQAYRAASNVNVKVKNVIGPLMNLLNKNGCLVVTHSSGGKSIQKILKTAFKDLEAFPNKAIDIINFLKVEAGGFESKFSFGKPFIYNFQFRKTPDQKVSELFGNDLDSKWANILYVGQIPEKNILKVERNKTLFSNVKKILHRTKNIEFENEIFKIKKIK